MKRKLALRWLTALAVIFLMAICIHPGYGQSDNQGQVRLSASQLVYDREKDQLILSGDVHFYYKDSILSGNRATFNTTTQVGSIEGKVRISQPGTTVTGHRMEVDYKSQKADIREDVKIVTVRDVTGTGEDSLESGVTTITSDRMEYEWTRQQGTARGNVTVIQKDRRVHASQAYYDGGAEIITLSGKVRFEQGAGNWMTSEQAVIDLRRQTFMAKGAVTGTFIVDDLKQDADGSKQDTASPKTPPRVPDKIVVPRPPFDDGGIPR